MYIYLLTAVIMLSCSLVASEADHIAVGNPGGIDIGGPTGTHLSLNNQLWGKGWSYANYRATLVATDARYAAQLQAVVKGDATVSLNIEASAAGQKLLMHYNLSVDQDVELTLAVIQIPVRQTAFKGSKIVAIKSDQSSEEKVMPMDKLGFSGEVQKLILTDRDGNDTLIEFNPAVTVASDNDLRVVLAKGAVTAGIAHKLDVTITLPGSLQFYPSASRAPDPDEKEHWFPWQPNYNYAADSISDMSNWLEKPAGKHGRITRTDDKLIYHNQPFTAWGINVCFDRGCAPIKEIADKRAIFYARNGINAVRFHKYADGHSWAGIQSKDSFAALDPAGLDRMDYFVAQLKAQGIYIKLSANFMVKLGPADKEHVPYMDEFGPLKNQRVNTNHGAIYLSKELQDIQILQLQNLLRHKNPYTGLTYAEDPAVMVVELFNEDSALWNGVMGQLRKSITLRQYIGTRFTAWLRDKYGDETKLIETWGDGVINSFAYEKLTGESFADESIIPIGGAWYYDPDQLEGSQKSRKPRLLDTIEFLYDIQNECYDRMVAGIRDAGYEGEILASNWQAGRNYSHYLNLHSDYRIGLIDRHNYFGGTNPASMLRVPGSGIMSTGMQQVIDRPFMLSEWIHTYPSQWGVEGPAIIAAYGMGLQGWDVSFMFQNADRGEFLDKLGGTWEVSAPQILGVFPAVARQVLRGDVREGPVISTRNVHVPSLSKGILGFDENVSQMHDVKVFDGDKVPSKSLALGRVVVAFTDEQRETEKVNLDSFVNNGVYTSNTGELVWVEGRDRLDGHFTINTSATQAVVGFVKDQKVVLNDVSIKSQNMFSAIYVTAKEADKDLHNSSRLLIVAIGRAHNTDMKYFNNEKLLEAGNGPILMEPVIAEINLKRSAAATVYMCDQDGIRTDTKLAVNDGSFTINGRDSKSIYYEVAYE